MQLLAADPIHPLRKRLWQAAILLGLFMLLVVTGETISRTTNGSHRLSLGEDFLPPYAAGTLIREGRAGELYAMEPLAQIERKVVAEADLDPLPVYGTFLNPPFFAAAYVPFAALPYRQALGAWLALNLLLLAGSIVLLCRMLPAGTEWKSRALLPLLIVLPLPFWEAMIHQQNTFVSLVLLCGTVTFWRSSVSNPAVGIRRSILCGAIAGLLFFKPQLAVAVALVLVLTEGVWALVGLSITGAALLLFTLRFMPGTLPAYLRVLPPTIHWMRTARVYNWGRQVTPQSFFRLLLQGDAIGETNALPRMLALLIAAAIASALIFTVVRYLRGPKPVASLDRLIAATIASMPVLMPYYMDYDLMLFAIPAVLLAADWMRSPVQPAPSDRWLLAAWIALFLEMYVNPGLGKHLSLNLAPPLIATISALSIWRCLRTRLAAAPANQYDTAGRTRNTHEAEFLAVAGGSAVDRGIGALGL